MGPAPSDLRDNKGDSKSGGDANTNNRGHHRRGGAPTGNIARLATAGPGNATLLDSPSGPSPLHGGSAASQRQGTPTVLRFPCESGNTVSVVGSFNTWKPLPMTKSNDEFFIILSLPKGTHTYHYLVENEPRTDPNQKTVNQGGTVYNVLNVVDADIMDVEAEEAKANDLQWGQERAVFEETKKVPAAS
eukprot:PhM_4_TR11966/c0_g1_i1/m.31003/K07199/PRKAB; 5'-AMP-activated protein kinase, regulatory beta subunit